MGKSDKTKDSSTRGPFTPQLREAFTALAKATGLPLRKGEDGLTGLLRHSATPEGARALAANSGLSKEHTERFFAKLKSDQLTHELIERGLQRDERTATRKLPKLDEEHGEKYSGESKSKARARELDKNRRESVRTAVDKGQRQAARRESPKAFSGRGSRRAALSAAFDDVAGKEAPGANFGVEPGEFNEGGAAAPAEVTEGEE